MKTPTAGAGAQQSNAAANAAEVEKKSINGELWQACAGPLVNLPAAGTHVVYFPQGHSEQVAASMKKDVDAQIPNYPNLPSKLLCLLHNVTLHADPETDEVYAQMTLQPVPSFDKDALLRSDLSMKVNKPQIEFFCKTLTASDTSTHGGFSVPRRAAEKIFPSLDFTMQPPAQELMARDLHDNAWTFRHIYRGQPKRHLLTTGWSLFVSGKRLFAGDSVLFIRDEKQQLLLGIRRANRQPTNLSSSVLSSDSMHIGVLAAAAHAAANNSPFTVFYNPRASPSEFVIPLAKYYKAVCSNQISLGMRFRMMFETEESGTRRYMGTITGISDLDSVRWKNSQWRNLQVGWDESTASERRNRVSIWEIEPVTAPFFICPTPPFFRSKRPRQPGMPDDESSDLDNLFRRTMPWIGDDFGVKDPQAALPGLSLVQWMNMQQNPSLANSMQQQQQPSYMNMSSSLPGSVLQNFGGAGQMGLLPPTQIPQQFNAQRPTLPGKNLDPLSSIVQPQPQPHQQLTDGTQPRQNLISQTLPTTSQVQSQMMLPSQNHVQTQTGVPHQQQSLLNHQFQRNLSQNLPHQQQIMSNSQQQNPMHSQPSDNVNQQLLHASDNNQMQIQFLQKLHQQQQQQKHQQQQSLLAQPSQVMQFQDHHQKQQLLDVAPNNFSSRSVSTTSQTLDSSQAATSSSMIPQSRVISHQQMMMSQSNNSQQTNLRFAPPPQQQQQQQPKFQSELPEHFTAGGGVHSAVTDDVPSCSTSPSTNNCPNAVQTVMMNSRNHRSENTHRSSAPLLVNPSGLETIMPCSGNNIVKELLQQKADVKPSLNISKNQNQGFFPSPTYMNNISTGPHMDYLDSSSSATSVLSQNDVQIRPSNNNNSMSFNSQSILFRDASHDGEVQGGDARSNLPFGANIMDNNNQLGIPMMPETLITKNMVGPAGGPGLLSSYESPKEAQPELSSSMVSQSFAVPDMAFNSIDSSTMNDGSFMNRGAWVPPQIPRLRTYTKVYKRGAVGRSIDIARYSGYDELKQDLAQRFGIEGQLEDRQRIGWKLVYVDHENDVLLVGDDPWEEFVNCARCIKILSPQEVQQMSLDGDFGNNVFQNQDCSSSDNGVN